MRRPWQIWLVFTACLLLVFGGMTWLSLHALQLERERQQSRVEAEQEEDVRQALWHLDSLVIPILAQESAWPNFAYQPYQEQPSKGKTAGEPIPSPLLVTNSKFVALNFECGLDKKFKSPQVPPVKMNDWARDNGSSEATLKESAEKLAKLQTTCSPAELLAVLPEETLWLNRGEIANANSLTLPNTINGSTLNVGGSTIGVNNTYTGDTQLNSGVLPNGYTGNTTINKGNLDLNANTNGTNNEQPTATQGGTIQVPAQPGAVQQAANPYLSQRGGAGQGRRGGTVQTNIAGGNAETNPQQDVNIDAQDQQALSPQRQQDQSARNYASLDLRSRAYTTYEQNKFQQQYKLQKANDGNSSENAKPNPGTPSGVSNLREGLARAVWIDDLLLFARRVTVNGETRVQGCWLDWSKLHDWLLSEISTNLPDAELSAIGPEEEVARGRILATLPVKLSVPRALFVPTGELSPLRMSLLTAWGCALLAAVAVALLLLGVITLSERRGAFVSAVTHELRTPLTTFRMYAEMLSEGMVKDAAQEKSYLHTLRAEADRLTHLVGNVLAYARLERGKLSDRLRLVSVEELLEHSRERLAERAKQSDMQLLVECDETTLSQQLRADTAAVEQIFFNLIDNACKYAADATDRRLHLHVQRQGRKIYFRVCDHGAGVSAKEAKRLFQPFRKSAKDAALSAPGVGLGLALCRRLARDLGGELTSEDQHGSGACFVLSLPAT